MTHFEELIETVVMTTGLSKIDIAKHLGCSANHLRYMMVKGPATYRLPRIMMRLKALILSDPEHTVSTYYALQHKGYSDIEIAKKWNIHPSGLYQWKKRRGLTEYRPREEKEEVKMKYTAKIRRGKREMVIGTYETLEEANRAEMEALEALGVVV